MTIIEKVARAMALSDPDITPESRAKLNWPSDWGEVEVGDLTTAAIAAITAFLEAIGEKGWRIVPDEATPNMAIRCLPSNTGRDNYRAMLAFSPKFEWDK